jgi:membrane-bound lytic murein transglycosylase F
MDIRKPFVLVIKSFLTSLTLGLVLLTSCALLVRSAPPSQLEQVLTTGELRVLSSNGPTTFYEGPNGLTGFEYSLAKGFADSLGVKLVIDDESNLSKLLDAVNKGEYDLAAAGLTAIESRQERLTFSSPYMQVTQQLIYNSRLPAPASIRDLKGKEVLVIADSAHSERLRELQQEFPELVWRQIENLEMIDLLEMVHKGKADYVVLDSNAYDVNRYSYPRARLAFDISDPQPLAWAFQSSRDQSLYKAAQKYLARIKQNGALASITDKFFNQHIEEVTTGEAMVFAYRLEKRLPQWADEMKKSAAEFNLDWELLAAISYQESHWQAHAKSYTGVRGLMMLTQRTARAMGVSDREDPAQSIYGGAKYFRRMLDRLPKSISNESERINMALAAYNQGLGHLEDARVLTQRMGGNPNKWSHVAKYMPLLAKQQYYSKARHGYVRGWEPVKFVENIRNYHKILSWHQKQEAFRLATANTGNLRADLGAEEEIASNKSTSKLEGDSASLSVL